MILCQKGALYGGAGQHQQAQLRRKIIDQAAEQSQRYREQKKGCLEEYGNTLEVLSNPKSEYTKSLLASSLYAVMNNNKIMENI